MPAATRWLRRGLDVLLVGLVALAVAGALVTSTARGVGAVLLGAALLALYVVGRRRVPVPVDVRAPRGAWWPAGAWVTGLVALWVGLSLVTTTAVWVAFPLMFVAMHVLGPRRGPVAVAVVVVLVVGVMAAWTARVALPFVLGPAIGGAVAVVVVLALEAVVRESQERQRTLDELVRTRDELAASERERAVAAERERLAREIHDTLAQGFSSAELLLRAARTALDAGDAETARGYVEQTREVARHNLAEARRVVRALAPADLASSNLVGALRRVADRASGRAAEGGPRVVVRVSGQLVPLPTEVEAALLRVAQSALANVERHAGATRAAVTVSFLAGTGPGDDAVALDVVDDGRGFDPDAVPAPAADRPGGFGLGAMRARVADLGGTLSVESAPGAGTAVAAWVPLAATTGTRSGAAADHRADDPADDPADRPADRPADTRTETDACTEGGAMTGTAVDVVLADDHPVVRTGLRAVLEAEPDVRVVAEVGSAEELLARLRGGLRADVVLLDLQFGPGRLGGVDAVREIVATDGPPVLVVTTYDADADILAAVEAGARGYLLKDAPTHELVAAVRAAAAGEVALGPAVQRRLLGRLRSPGTALTARELEVLALVAEGRTNDEIAHELFLSRATVKTHLVHVYDKLGAPSRTAAVAEARRRGLLRG